MKKCKRGHDRVIGSKACKICQTNYGKAYRLAYKKAFDPIHEALKKARREASRLSRNTRNKDRLATDPIRKLKFNLRSRVSKALKGRYKSGSAVRDLGCTGEELKLYLESQFVSGMTWDNYGTKPGFWSIDHIIPLSIVDLTDREEFLKVNHYTNLRPLWHIDNIKKGNRLEKET